MLHNMIVIGENLNATRKFRVGGARVDELDDGRIVVKYQSIDGEARILDVSDSARDERGNRTRFVPHIAAGILQRDDGYIRAVARLQERAGADYIDLCVDEISPHPEDRYEHIEWAVRTVQEAVSVPLSIDSSDTGCIQAALEVYDFDASDPPIINSVNLEEARLPLIEIARKSNSSLIANASGEVRIPAGVDGRMENLGRIMERMDAAGIPMGKRFLDPLVLPIATDNSNGRIFLDTVSRLREKYPDVHITGGFSNVSFGLPMRRVLNDAMTYLAREAGADTAFIDPTATKEFDLEDEGFRKAIAALRGEDEFCADYMMWAQG